MFSYRKDNPKFIFTKHRSLSQSLPCSYSALSVCTSYIPIGIPGIDTSLSLYDSSMDSIYDQKIK